MILYLLPIPLKPLILLPKVWAGKPDQVMKPLVLNTLFEHNSNDLPWRRIPYFSIIRLQMDAEGFMDMNELETLLRSYNQNGQHGKKRIRLVAVSGASNVLGVFNNLEKISQVVHLYGARLLVDAAQLVAHRKVEVERSGIDYLAFSAHKVYAPFGTGVLLARKGLLNFTPAEMEMIQASGEENAAGIAALGKALCAFATDWSGCDTEGRTVTDRLYITQSETNKRS